MQTLAKKDTKQKAKWVRLSRWLHRKVAIALFVFFLIMSVTGILLGIKKQSGLLAPTQKGMSANPAEWLPVDSLQRKANRFLLDSVDAGLSTALDRIDIRPEKGVVKFVYKNHYWGLQLDCTSGALLLIEKRRSDFIEALHDGSVLDDWLGTGNEGIKLGYTVLMGTSLLLLVLSGLWLWYGPKRIRSIKRGKES